MSDTIADVLGTTSGSIRAIAASRHRATHEPSCYASRPFGWVSHIAGALHDWRGLLVIGLLVGLAVLA